MKKTLLYIGLGILAIASFGGFQINKVKNIVDNIKFKLDRVNALNFLGNIINLNVNIKVVNNSNNAFSVNTGNVIALNKLEFFTDTGVKFAEATKQVNNINLQPNGFININDVDVVVDTRNIGPIVLQLINNTPEKIVTKAHIAVLGENFII